MVKPGRTEKNLEFRVIAGDLKGKRITLPDLGVTRPPLTRLRRSIFDFLNPYLPKARYLDLYSGTGSYLFEAVSRGVVGALGVEMEKRLAESINDQAKEIGVSGRLKCRCANVLDLLPKLSAENQRYDIVMIAPPQYKGLIDQTLKLLAQHELLIPEGMAICQHDSSETVRIDFETSGARIEDGSVDRAGLFEIAQQRKYGNTTFTVLKRR